MAEPSRSCSFQANLKSWIFKLDDADWITSEAFTPGLAAEAKEIRGKGWGLEWTEIKASQCQKG